MSTSLDTTLLINDLIDLSIPQPSIEEELEFFNPLEDEILHEQNIVRDDPERVCFN
jgi:hypothetical protein